MSLKNKTKSGLAWQSVEILSRQAISLLVYAILSRALEPTSFGIFGLVSFYLSCLAMLASQGIGTAIIQSNKITQEHLDTAFWIKTGVAVSAVLCTLALAEPIAALFSEPKLAPYLRVACLVLIFDSTSSIHNTLFNKNLNFKLPALRLLISNSIGGAVGITMALRGFGAWSLVAQHLATSITGAIFLWSASPFRPTFHFSWNRLRDMSSVSSSVFVSSILWFFTSKLDQFAIGKYLGPATLGVYMIAIKLPELAKIFTTQPISKILLPALAKIQDDPKKLNSVIYRGMEFNALFAFPVYVGIATVAPDLIPLAFGDRWTDAIAPMQLLAMLALVYNLQVFVHPALIASGGVGKYLILNFIQFSGVLVSCFVGTRVGLVALVACLIGNSLIALVLALAFLRKRIGLSPIKYLSPCAVPALASAAMYAALFGLQSAFDHLPHLLSLCVLVPCGALLYASQILIFRRQAVYNVFEFFNLTRFLPIPLQKRP